MTADPQAPVHLILEITNRGFARMPELSGEYGGSVQLYESSGASEPQVWLKAAAKDGHETIVLLAAQRAWHLSEQVEALLAGHHHGDARPVRWRTAPYQPRTEGDNAFDWRQRATGDAAAFHGTAEQAARPMAERLELALRACDLYLNSVDVFERRIADLEDKLREANGTDA